MEFLFEMVIYPILAFPGALVRWIFLRKKYSFKEILKMDLYTNGFIGLIVLMLLISTFLIIRQL